MVLKAHLDLESRVFDDRRESRRALQLETSGTLPGGVEANVTVHNISTSGLLLQTELPLEQGEVLAIELPSIGAIDAEIVWRSEYLFGCEFTQTLDGGALAAAYSHDDAQGLLGSKPYPVSLRAPQQTLSPGYSEPFGQRISRLRREQGLTLAQIANALDVSKPTVWAWEKGKAKPLPERIEAIAKALGVSTKEISDSTLVSQGSTITEECRLRIATSYGTDPKNVRIMIEV